MSGTVAIKERLERFGYYLGKGEKKPKWFYGIKPVQEEQLL